MQGVKKVFGSDEVKQLVDPYLVFSFAGAKVIDGANSNEFIGGTCKGLVKR